VLAHHTYPVLAERFLQALEAAVNARARGYAAA
jgi:hypothetical protein